MPRRPGDRTRFRPWAEALESRVVLSVTIQLDYSRDTLNFFNTQARRDILQAAADTLGSRLSDSLLAINPVPGGGDTWTAVTDDPSTGQSLTLVDPVIPANTLRIFAGGRNLPGTELGRGGFGAFSASGSQDWLDLVTSRGQAGALAATKTDFGPWGGSLTFDTGASWYFGKDAAGLGAGQDDFLSVAIHELTHAIGFGTAPSWTAQILGGRFNGAQSKASYDAAPGVSVPLSPDGGHWANGTLDAGVPTAMDPSILQGTRKLATRLDFAGLQDVGWTLASDPDGTIAGATDTGITGADTKGYTGLSIGPGTMDVDLFRFTASAGQVLTASTGPRVGGTPVDTYIRLFNAAGVELKSANTFVYDSLNFTLTATGTYFIGVSGLGNAAYSVLDDLSQRLAGPTGDYDLTIRLDRAAGGTVADLSTLVVAPATATRGVPLTYTATVANSGPDAASATRLVGTLPGSVTIVSAVASQGTVNASGGVLTVNFGTLAPGLSATVLVTVIPNAAATLTFAVAASATQVDLRPADNVTSDTTVVSESPEVPGSDTTPPIVLGFRRVTSGKGARRVTTIIVSFSDDIDPASAASFGVYALTKNGQAKRGRPIPRVRVGIRAASFDPLTHTMSLVSAFQGAVPKGLRLIIAASPPQGVRDLAGNALDGDQDGVAGGDAVVQITR